MRLAVSFALVPFLALLAGCESGLATVVHVDVADAVATAQSVASPGVLVTDAGTVTPLAALCGDPLAEPVIFSFDHGFGCLDDAMEGTEQVLRAWVQPMPAEWDAAAFCALEPAYYSGIVIGTDVTGTPDDTAAADDTAGGDTAGDTAGGDTAGDTAGGDTADTGAVGVPGLASEPESGWAKGAVTAVWKRDFSPCGGVLRGDLTVE